MEIRIASDEHLPDVLLVEGAAFAEDPEVLTLVADLLRDPSARPVLSLLACDGDRPVGHILFSAAHVDGVAHPVSAVILAPLAVAPDSQRQGVGGALIERGLELLAGSGTELVFVLGHPEYYPRHGFEPAAPLGLPAPFPIPEEKSDAWMVRALRPGVLGEVSGTVMCADAMNKAEYWRE